MMGGYNVSGEMGLTILRHFPSVDYISFGEGDETIARFCADLISGSADSLPYGTLGRNDMIPETAPYRMTKDMNTVATPDYRDFFEEIHLEESGFYGEKPVYYAQTYENTVFLEGSRGCWWGVKHPCSFCGLNGLTNVYREKTPEKLYSEIREMTARYPGSNIQLTDNVLSLKMIREICPPLTEDPEPYSISAEIKSNLRPDDIKLLAQAGVKITQPGIESLNDHLLKLMGKGCNTVQNIALMKYCKTYGVFPVWNLLIQVPDENREDYEEMISLIPQICHLNPPTAAFTIAYNRFSRYTDHPGDYGLELKPEPVYQCCFPDEPDIVNHMFVYFQLTGGSFVETIRQNRDLYRRINDAVGTWRKQYYSETPPSLVMTEFIFGISILDTRPCALEVKRMLIGLSAKIYRLAWEPVSLQSLLKNLPGYEEKEIRETLDLLVSQKLMIFMSGKYLALAVAR